MELSVRIEFRERCLVVREVEGRCLDGWGQKRHARRDVLTGTRPTDEFDERVQVFDCGDDLLDTRYCDLCVSRYDGLSGVPLAGHQCDGPRVCGNEVRTGHPDVRALDEFAQSLASEGGEFLGDLQRFLRIEVFVEQCGDGLSGLVDGWGNDVAGASSATCSTHSARSVSTTSTPSFSSASLTSISSEVIDLLFTTLPASLSATTDRT